MKIDLYIIHYFLTEVKNNAEPSKEGVTLWELIDDGRFSNLFPEQQAEIERNFQFNIDLLKPLSYFESYSCYHYSRLTLKGYALLEKLERIIQGQNTMYKNFDAIKYPALIITQ